jgi:flagellar protein FliL
MAENELDSGEEKKSSKKLIIIIAVVVLLMGGGGAGYFFMAEEPENGETEEVEEVVEEADKELLYFEMKKPFIVDFPKGASARLVQISVAILVEGEETVAALTKHEPMIRNNLLMLINNQNPDELKESAGKDKLREEMIIEVGEVLEKMSGSNHVKEIFFTAFVMQ